MLWKKLVPVVIIVLSLISVPVAGAQHMRPERNISGPSGSTMTLSPNTGPPGIADSAQGKASSYKHMPAQLLWDGITVLSTFTIPGSGNYSSDFVVPASAAGNHSVTLQIGSTSAASSTFLTQAKPTSTAVPTATGTRVPTATATTVPTATTTPTATATAVPTATATTLPTDTPTLVPTATPTQTNTPVPTNTATLVPTNTAVPPTNTAVPPTSTPTNTLVPPTSTPTNTAVPTATSSGFGPPASGAYVGVWQPGVPTDFSGLNTFESQAGKHMAIVMFWRDWASDSGTINPAWLSTIAARGSVPMITWSPANWSGDSSSYTLANITNGTFDSYIRQTADTLRNYGGPVLLRTMHEMNGNWYTHWSGNPTGYVAAWKHIHDIFTQEGATNVRWVWSPNTFWSGSLATDPSAYYPGNAYVDWVGLDGYNRSDWGYMSFSKIFSYAVSHETTYGKPIMIAETASGEFNDGGVLKSQWITDTFSTAIPSMPAIKAILWFNEDKTASENCPCQWPTNSTSVAQSAFTAAVVNPYYVSKPS